jgi:hypothetical protein
MNAQSGLYPFFLLGLRRASERAGSLGWSTLVAAIVAYLPITALMAASLIESQWFPAHYITVKYYTPEWLFVALVGGVCAAGFILPFAVAGASDLFYRVHWRANSLLLASPLTARDLLWGKLTVLFVMGIPVLLALVPAAAVLALGVFPTGTGFLGIFAAAFLVYFVSAIFLSAFTKRWEAVIFWIALVPLSAAVKGVIWLTIYLTNLGLAVARTYAAGKPIARAIPTGIHNPNLPIWLIAVIAAVVTLYLLLRRGAREIEKMRTGEISLGRLTSKSIADYRSRTKHAWARPEYTHAGLARTARELYIPVEPGLYTRTATDVIFDFFVAIAFLGKGTMRRLVESMPRSIEENPIYIRHTSRFRGFLAGYFEPSGQFKSRVILQAGAILIAGFFCVLVALSGSMGFLALSGIAWTLIVFGVLLAIMSPFDACIRLARMHRERLAWESVIITPLSGRAMISGTFGVLITHRLLPMLPGSLWIILLGLLPWAPPWGMIVALFFVFSLYFAGLSLAASTSWLVSKPRLAASMTAAWVTAFGLILAGLIWRIPLTMSNASGWLLVDLPHRPMLELSCASIVLILLGLVMPAVAGWLFDRFARVPFAERREEEE